MIRSSVVLPQPLGPRTTMVWPSGILRLRCSMRNVDSAPPRRPDSVSVFPTSMRSILAMRARLFELQVLERRRVREAGDAAVAGVGHARPHPPDERLLEERDGRDLVADDLLDLMHHGLALLGVELVGLSRVQIVDLLQRAVG